VNWALGGSAALDALGAG
jgi:hypothetical protein